LLARATKPAILKETRRLSNGGAAFQPRSAPPAGTPKSAAGIARALLHDIELPEFDADLNTVGLITHKARKKPGHKEFKALKNRLPSLLVLGHNTG
jgi:hypothetical protein